MEVRNTTQTRVAVSELSRLAHLVLKHEEYEGKSNLSLLIVGKDRMARLSKQWLSRTKPCNVLAFEGGELSLGEIVLCPQVIAHDALEYGITKKDAVALMFVHGLLHLLGYDHQTANQEQKMKAKEQTYLKQ